MSLATRLEQAIRERDEAVRVLAEARINNPMGFSSDFKPWVHAMNMKQMKVDDEMRANESAILAALKFTEAVERHGWFLPASRLNDIQRDHLREDIKRTKRAHYTNLQIRINGEYEYRQADYFKHLVEICVAPKERT